MGRRKARNERTRDLITRLMAMDARVLDTETTSLRHRRGTRRAALTERPPAQAVQLAILSTTGAVLFDEMLQPTCTIEPTASMVHGITEQHLDNPGICTIASHYGAICTILGARRVLAWNSTFDQDVLEHSLRVWALQPPCARWHCAMRATAQYLRLDRDRLSLSEACDRLGVRQIVEPAHSAYGDCLRVLGVLQAIREGR